MATAVIRDNHMKFNGKKYFRGGAEDIDLGDYGEKRTPVFGANFLSVYKHVPFKKLKIRKPTEVDIDFSSTTESDISANFGMRNVIGASGGNVFSKLRSGELKLMKFAVDIGDMVDACNSTPPALNWMIDAGNDVRLAHQIFVVVSADLAETVNSATSFDVSGSNGSLEVAVKGKVRNGRTTKITLSPKTTFSYLLMKPKWNSANKRKRTKMVSGRADQWGP